MPITELIDKQDNFEIVRDQIAAILTSEVASQMAQATAAGKNPEDWRLRVFSERSNPFEQWLNRNDLVDIDRAPIINVWFDNSSFDPRASNIAERQKTEATYNIDCYGRGYARDDGAGHMPGDLDAALECHRAVRLVRNILMSAEYAYLGMQGVVWQRWSQSINVFQPQLDGHAVQQVEAARLSLRVTFNELSPQIEPTELCLVSAEVKRAETGEIFLTADYDYTL